MKDTHDQLFTKEELELIYNYVQSMTYITDAADELLGDYELTMELKMREKFLGNVKRMIDEMDKS